MDSYGSSANHRDLTSMMAIRSGTKGSERELGSKGKDASSNLLPNPKSPG